MRCAPGSDDKCTAGEWYESWGYNDLSKVDCQDLLSAGGCLYSIMANMDIYRCCATDGICETDNGDWSLVVDSAGAGGGKMLYVNGKLIYGGQINGGVDLMQLDTLGETSQAKESVLWDHSYRGAFPYLFKDGAMWIGTIDMSLYGDIFVWPLDTGMITDYRGNTTAGNGVSSIVGYVSKTAQTAAVSEANIFIPPADGFYRVSIYQAVTAYSSGTLQATINFTDDIGATTQTSTALTSATRSNDSFIIYAKALDPISYSIATGGGTMTYNAYITIERLN